MALFTLFNAFQQFLAIGPFLKYTEASGPVIHFSHFILDFKKVIEVNFRNIVQLKYKTS